jgi:hypothetical protein
VEDEEYQPDTSFYVEKDTRFIYEVQFFPKFVLIKPASPAFGEALRQLTSAEFAEEFEEFWGDQRQVREILRGMASEIGVE